MSNNKIIKFDPTIPAQFKDWFGPPAVLTAEDLQIHDRILCGLFHDVRPQGLIEYMFIDDLAYNVCLRLALRRRRDKVIRHANNEKFERQKRELLQDAERRKVEIRRLDTMFEPRYPGARDAKTQTRIAIEREIQEAKTNKRLAEIDAETNNKLAELQKAKDDPFDEVETFDQWIDAVERIEEELAVADQNFRITLKLLDEHRTGLGQRFRQVADEVVDVEFTEEQAPAREGAVASAEAAFNTAVSKASAQPTTASSVAELPAPASSQTNGGAHARLQALAEPAPAPERGRTEQQ
jgi:hypothetical protein